MKSAFLGFFLMAHTVYASHRVISQVIPGEYLAQFDTAIATNRNYQRLVESPNIKAVELIDAKAQIYKIATVKSVKLKQLRRYFKKIPLKYLEPNLVYKLHKTPDDPAFTDQWGLSNEGPQSIKIDIGAEQAWNITTGKKDVIVAVIDTGIDYNHPDLKQNMWINQLETEGLAGIDDDKNGFVDDDKGYDFANNDNDPFDDLYHGTHVAGIIGAQAHNGIGISGVMWNVRLMAIKSMKADAGGTLETAIRSIHYAVKNGAKIINASWGGGSRSQILEDVLASAGQAGVLFVASAGNSGVNNDINPQYPASYKLPNVISVAAMDRSGQLVDWSNYGERSVHIAAPGVNILSTLPDGKFDYLSGTSMAAPFVSGVAALLLSQFPDMTTEELRLRLTKKGLRLNSLKNKISTRTFLHAYGALTNTNPVSESDSDDVEQWQQIGYNLKSSSPYVNKKTYLFEIQVSGMKRMALHFKKFDTEEGFDLLRIFDKNNRLTAVMSGQLDDSYSPPIEGDYARLELTTDENKTGQGFEIDRIGVEK